MCCPKILTNNIIDDDLEDGPCWELCLSLKEAFGIFCVYIYAVSSLRVFSTA